MSAYLQASSRSPPPKKAAMSDIGRGSASYHPSVWGHHFLAYDNPDQARPDGDTKEKHEKLKEEVKNKLSAAAYQPQRLLKLINDIQLLGVAYHFESEINVALDHMNDTFSEFYGTSSEADDLQEVALCFRLLRQHGHNVSSDVFSKFKNSKGIFKECLFKDVLGLLNLYQAAHLRVKGEEILEEALVFTTSQLDQLLKSNIESPLAAKVIHALNMPIRKGLTRLESRHYISIYQENILHDSVLLNFAKLDFNLLQKLHQGELSAITRWWKDLNVAEKLPFARDRMVECYFWMLGVYYEPQYQLARRFVTKVISLTSITDDIYDVYGKMEELVLFTDAIERWDISASDQLPEYMRLVYQTLINVFNEMEKDMADAGRTSYFLHYAKDAFKSIVKAYHQEAVWLQQGYIPTMEEYMHVALVTAGYMMLSTTSFVGMGDMATKEVFDWVSSDPLIVIAASLISRLTDDIVGHETEQERKHVASGVECYMKQHGVSKECVYADFSKQITDAWKDMNQECLNQTVAMPFLERVFNLARVINLLYDGEDMYKNSKTKTKELVKLVLVDPVPI